MTQSKRTGDAIPIAGDYQYKALTEGHPVQRFWHGSKHRAIARWLPPQPEDVILDVGCGSGVITHFLGESGAAVLGIDGNDAAIAFAEKSFAAPNVSFQKGLVDDLFVCPAPPDKIYCLEVIEHIYFEQGAEMLANFFKLLKPGGRLFLTTPNYRSAWPLIEWAMARFTSAPPMDEAQHVAHYTRARLGGALSKAGFQVETLTSFCFVAPWLAPLGFGAALTLERLEMALPLVPGSILVATARKPLA